MNDIILEKLSPLTDEEKSILSGGSIEKQIYTEKSGFVIDSQKLLEKGKLIDMRPHTRFAHFPEHTHNYIELIYMCKGTTTHIINGDKINLNEGEILLLSQNCAQEILPAGKEDIAVNFIIVPEFFASESSFPAEESIIGEFLINCLTCGNDFSEYLYYKVSDNLPIRNLAENMIWTVLNPHPFGRRILENTMNLLFLQLVNSTDMIKESKSDYEKQLLLKSLHYIENNYKTASLTELSKQLNQSVFIMSRLIKQYTGKTYNDLLKSRRLSQAVYLLTHTRLDIAGISADVGYENRSYFYRIFNEKYGMTPKDYRNKYFANKDTF